MMMTRAHPLPSLLSIHTLTNKQAFSFHLFAKRPIESVQTLADYRRSVMKRIAILALQIRLNVLARDDPPFTFIEFNQLDSAR